MIELPSPAPDEVLVRVVAIGINRVDVLQRSGASKGVGVTVPAGLGMEAAGTVERVGSQVLTFSVGDKVNLLPGMAKLPFGSYCDFLSVPATALIQQPASLSFQQGAALWTAHLTAYAPLVELAGVGPGDSVLINAASSSVGLAAIGITRTLGAIPIAITRTQNKVEALLKAGAAHVIISGREETALRARELTAGGGARVAFDPVGGPAIASLLDAVATDGILVWYGILSGQATPLPFSVLGRNLTIAGYALDINRNPRRRARALDFICQGVANGTLTTHIEQTFPLSDAARAHTALETNEHIGKLLLLP
ncbi:MAG: zinc-dependent alcohol dehydrogenase family protein [Janthinobacterium lividum]